MGKRSRRKVGDINLTAREVEILEITSRGASSRECAAALGLTLGTIHTYKKRLYKKLGVNSLLAAVNLWQRRNRVLDEKMEGAAGAIAMLAELHLMNADINTDTLPTILQRASEIAFDRRMQRVDANGAA
jgi:DNA-binding CsgD family transcriptional regulator